MDINNFPDKLFTKKQLLEKFFPAIHKSTLERYMRDINKNDDFKEIISRPTSQMTNATTANSTLVSIKKVDVVSPNLAYNPPKIQGA